MSVIGWRSVVVLLIVAAIIIVLAVWFLPSLLMGSVFAPLNDWLASAQASILAFTDPIGAAAEETMGDISDTLIEAQTATIDMFSADSVAGLGDTVTYIGNWWYNTLFWWIP